MKTAADFGRIGLMAGGATGNARLAAGVPLALLLVVFTEQYMRASARSI